MFRRFLSFLLIVGMALSSGCASALTEFTDGPETTPAVLTSGVEDIYGPNDRASITNYKVLRLGDRDTPDGAAYIVMLQLRLIQLGFLQDSADGIYGSNTEKAVAQFQMMNGLERTGIADVTTQQKLFSEITALTTASPSVLLYNSEEVAVQTKLAEWGFMTGKVDGILGSGSKEAILRFKNYVKDYDRIPATPTPAPTPTPTPVPTPAPGEMPVVIDEPLPIITPSPTPYKPNTEIDLLMMQFVDGVYPFDVYTKTVQINDRGTEVRRVQTRLKHLGYLYADPDGAFGVNTARALMYFQRKMGLEETAIADETTQRLLFSSEARRSEEYVFPYKLVVDISDQRVYAYAWNGSSYAECLRTMVCSTGKDETPTPLGTYQAYGQIEGEWYYFTEFDCYARWAYGVVGGILFHSVTYSPTFELNTVALSNLGTKASHGCIRLTVEDAEWIYDCCPGGTTVVIQE